MNTKKLLWLLALFLLTPLTLVYGQQVVSPSKPDQDQAIGATVAEKPQQQAQVQAQSAAALSLSPAQVTSSPAPGSRIFDGIVVQADPLEVKSVSGDIRTFLPVKQQAPAQLKAAWPASGDLVSLTY